MQPPARTEMIPLISVEASRLRDFLAGLDTEAWSRPSACAAWTVGDVVAHLTQGAQTWSAAITRARAGDTNPPAGEQMPRPGERASEVIAQRAIAFRQGIGEAALLHAFSEGCQRLHQVLLTLQPIDWDKPCYHRHGIIMPIGDYVDIRLEEMTIHGWDIRSAFDPAATLSEPPLLALLGVAQRWLSITFRPVPQLSAPIRYRFDVPGPAPVQQDVLVSQDGFRSEPVTDRKADVTFRCTTGDYLLLVFGRLSVEQAVDTGRLEIAGNRQQASLFTTLFQGI